MKLEQAILLMDIGDIATYHDDITDESFKKTDDEFNEFVFAAGNSIGEIFHFQTNDFIRDDWEIKKDESDRL